MNTPQIKPDTKWEARINDGLYEVWTAHRIQTTSMASGNYLVAAEIQDEGEAKLISAAPDLLAERDQLKADNARLREALTAVLRYCVTVEGMPDSDKGRTPHQACAMKQARQALA